MLGSSIVHRRFFDPLPREGYLSKKYSVKARTARMLDPAIGLCYAPMVHSQYR